MYNITQQQHMHLQQYNNSDNMMLLSQSLLSLPIFVCYSYVAILMLQSILLLQKLKQCVDIERSRCAAITSALKIHHFTIVQTSMI